LAVALSHSVPIRVAGTNSHLVTCGRVPAIQAPVDLRHAAVSTWVNATGDAARVAEWAAGHSLAVLLRVYAKCIDGGEQTA
jgi:hypothetical protein